MIPYFPACVDFIKSARSSGGTVLVHCYAGVSRSATIVIAYLMAEMNMGFMDAFSFTKSK